MSLTSVDYDARQKTIWRDQDDFVHSSQQARPVHMIEWALVDKRKERLLKQAQKSGKTLGQIYEQIDHSYIDKKLRKGLVKKKIKRTKYW